MDCARLLAFQDNLPSFMLLSCRYDCHRDAAPVSRCMLALALLLVLGVAHESYAQERTQRQEAAQETARVDEALLPESFFQRVEFLNVRSADLRDVLRSLAASYRVNLVVDERIQQPVTLALEDVTVIEAVLFVARTYGLLIEQTGGILRLYPRPPPAPPAPAPRAAPVITVERSQAADKLLLSADLDGADVRDVARLLTQRSGVNVVVPAGVTGALTAYLERIPLGEGLDALFGANGFTLARSGSVATVSRALTPEGQPVPTFGASGLTLTADSLITLRVQNASVAALTEDLANRFSLDLVLYAQPSHTATLRAQRLPLDRVLGYLYRGSELTYQLSGRTLVVGRRDGEGMSGTRMFPLAHLRAETAFELVPNALRGQASVQLVREHNALLGQGTASDLDQLQRYLDEIDRPTPLILIEALVVDFDESAIRELGFAFGRGLDSVVTPDTYRFEAGLSGSSGQVNLGASSTGRILQFGSDLLGLGQVRRLPADFYARIQALESEGRAQVVSRPQISTLSGHTATISVGTTQYYILRTTTPVGGGQGGFVPYESERFEQVEANVQVEVTPWVSTTGEVIAQVRPEFSTPVGRLTSAVPPTINTRVFDANVRLRDGETIILGGLIQETESRERSGVPYLSKIPWLGRLFRGSSTTTRRSELVVYLTPHVFYGDGLDAERWEALQERLQISNPDMESLDGDDEEEESEIEEAETGTEGESLGGSSEESPSEESGSKSSSGGPGSLGTLPGGKSGGSLRRIR